MSIIRGKKIKKQWKFIMRLYEDNRINSREMINLDADPRRRMPPQNGVYPAGGGHQRQGGMPPVPPQGVQPYGQRPMYGQQGGSMPNAPYTPYQPVRPQPAQTAAKAEAKSAAELHKQFTENEAVNNLNKLLSEEAKNVQQSAEAVSKAEDNKPAVEANAPHHHHDGVDLIKHDDTNTVQNAETAEKTETNERDNTQHEKGQGVQPNGTPVQPNARPVQPNARPVQPNGRPAQPYGTPVQPYGTPVQPNGRPVQPYGTPAQPYGTPVQPYGTPVQPNARPAQPYGTPAAAQTMQSYENRPLPSWAQQKPEKIRQPRPKRQYSSAAIFTGIGITFIVLAGMIFSTAFWVSMSDWARVGVLGGQAALFFGIYAVADKKLKIHGTSAAMYILGSVYTTITYITTGYFGLFGAWFGIEGRGQMLFLALGALLAAFFSARAMKIFKKPFCEYAAVFSMAISGTFLLGQIANYFERNYAAFALLITAAGTAFTAVYLWKRSRGYEPTKVMICLHIVIRAAYLVMAAPMLLMDMSQGAGYGWSVFGWGICIILMGECLWHAIRLRSEKWLMAHTAFVLAGAFSLYLNITDFKVFALIAAVFAMVGGWVYVWLEMTDRLLLKASKTYCIIRVTFIIPAFFTLFMPEYTAVQYITAGLVAADFAALAAVRREQYLLIPNCAAAAGLMFNLLYIADRNTILENGGLDRAGASLIILVIGIVGTALCRILDKLNKSRVDTALTVILMRIIMCLPAVYTLTERSDWGAAHWTMLGLMLAELTAYVIIRRSAATIVFQYIFLALGVFKLMPHHMYGADRLQWFDLVIWGICAAGTASYLILKKYRKNLFDADNIIALLRTCTAVICIFQLCLNANRWDCADWLMAGGMAVEMLILAICMRSQKLLAAHALFLTAILFECALIVDDIAAFSLWVTALLAASTMIYTAIDSKNKLRFRADFVIAVMRFIFGFTAFAVITTGFTDWNYDCFGICAVFALEMLYIGIVKKSEKILFAHALALTLMLSKLGEYTGRYEYFALMLCGTAAVGTLAYYLMYRAGKLLFETKKLLGAVRFAYASLSMLVFAFYIPQFHWTALTIAGLLCIEGLCYGIALKDERLVGLHALFLTCSLWQVSLLTHGISYFTLICCGTAAVGTFVYYQLRRADKLLFKTDFVLAGVRTFYGIVCIATLIGAINSFKWVHIVIAAVITIELTYYGILTKNRHMLRGQGFAMMATFLIATDMLDTNVKLPPHTAAFILAMLTAAGLVIYRIFKQLYTKTSDLLYMAVLCLTGFALMEDAALPYGVIAMLMVAVFVTADAFDDEHFLRKPMRILLPLPEMATALLLADYLDWQYKMSCQTMAMTVCAGVLCAAAFILSFGRHEDKKYSIMKYSTETGAALSLILAAGGHRSVQAGISVMIVSAALFAVMHLSKKNLHAAVPLTTVFIGASLTANSIWYDPMRAGSAMVVFSMAMTALLAVTSRLMFTEKLIKKNEFGKLHVDLAQSGILLCMMCCNNESMLFPPRARLFIALLELTVFIANFIRRSHSTNANRACTTLAAAAAGLALIVRPFMVFENSMLTMKIILAIIVAFGLAVKKIWADEEKISREFSQAVFMGAFITLIIDGLINQSLTNSLIVLSVSLVLLVYSFIKKTRRWFLVSAAALLGLTLYITGDFLAAIAWWVYLLLAGFVLIIVAALTEYFRQKAAKNPNEDRFFVDWKW